MNPLRYIGAELTPWVVAVFAFAVVILLVAGWARHRERHDEWGPGLVNALAGHGHASADLRRSTVVVLTGDAREDWLLGLAALYVEQAGLLHDRWSLVPALCGNAWRRRLLEVAQRWGVVRARDWRDAVADLEGQLVHGVETSRSAQPEAAPEWEARARLLAQLAMLLRLGVAARHTTASQARVRLAAVAEPLWHEYGDWTTFGSAIIASEARSGGRGVIDLRADLKLLMGAAGPWHEGNWPRDM